MKFLAVNIIGAVSGLEPEKFHIRMEMFVIHPESGSADGMLHKDTFVAFFRVHFIYAFLPGKVYTAASHKSPHEQMISYKSAFVKIICRK